MNFLFEHEFDATLEAIEAVIFDDPDFFEMLARECEGIEEVRPLSRRDEGDVIVREVAYRPRPRIPGFARRWITPDMVSWVEVSRYDRARKRFTYEIHPNIPEAWRDRFESTGSYELTPAGPGRTHRRIEGVIRVRAPLVGGVAERFLVGEIRRNFDQEAAALKKRLRP